MRLMVHLHLKIGGLVYKSKRDVRVLRGIQSCELVGACDEGTGRGVRKEIEGSS